MFVIDEGIILPGFLKWCEMDFVHHMFDCSRSKKRTYMEHREVETPPLTSLAISLPEFLGSRTSSFWGFGRTVYKQKEVVCSFWDRSWTVFVVNRPSMQESNVYYLCVLRGQPCGRNGRRLPEYGILVFSPRHRHSRIQGAGLLGRRAGASGALRVCGGLSARFRGDLLGAPRRPFRGFNGVGRGPASLFLKGFRVSGGGVQLGFLVDFFVG